MSAFEDGVNADALAFLTGVDVHHPHPTWTMSLQGLVVTANAALLEFLGVTLEELRVQPLTAALHPDDRPSLLPSDTARPHELRLRRHDGQFRWFQVTAQPLRQEGVPRGWRLAGVDIHEYRSAGALDEQALLENVIEGSSDCIKVLDLNAQLLSMNAGGMRVMEIDDFSTCRLASWPTFWEGDTRVQVEQAIQAARHGRTHVFEGPARTFKGTLRFWEVTVSPIRGRDGEVHRLLAISRDITQRRRQEEFITGQAQLLEQMATGTPLPEVLQRLVHLIEKQGDGLLCSVLQYDPHTRQLSTLAAPSLPAAFNGAIDGLQVGPEAGCCGAAVFLQTPVRTPDIAADPRWAAYREAALAHGLRACWSVPILSREGEVYGSLGAYVREPRLPTAEEEQLLSVATHLAQVAFERDHLLHAERQARQERDESAALLDAFFTAAPVGLAFFDPQLRFRKVNAALAAMSGRSTDDHLGRTVADLLPGVPGTLRPLQQVLETGEVLSDVLITGKTATAPGVARHWSERIFPVRDAAGNVLGVGVIATDITEQLGSRQAQQHSEDRFRALVLASVEIVWTTDPAGRVTERMPTWELFCGVTHEDLRDFGWVNTLHPDDRPNTLVVWAQAVRSRGYYQTEYRVRRADGEYRLMNVRGIPVLESDGTIREWVGSCVDITDQRQTQAQITRLAQIVEASNDFIGLAHLNGQAFYVNRYGRELVGLNEQDVARTAIIDYLPPEDRSHVLNTVMPALFQQGVWQSDTLFRHFQTNEAIAVNWNVFLVRDPATGEPTGIATVSRDIRERKRTEEALREQTERLSALNSVNQVISAELDLDELVQAVTDAAVELTGAQFGAFFYNVVNERQESYTLYTLSGVPREAFERFPMPRNTKVFGPTFAGEGVVRVADITADPRYGQNAPYQGMPAGHLPVRSYLAVPVKSRSGEVLGGLFFGHAEPGVFSERAEQLMVGLAAQTAVALDNARLYGQLQDSHAQLERRVQERTEALEAQAMSLDAFAAFTEAVGTETDVYALAREALAVLRTRFPEDSIGYYEPDAEVWKLRVWTEDIAPDVLTVLQAGLPAETPAIVRTLATRTAVFIDAWDADRERIERTEVFDAVGAYPLVVDGEVQGILSIGRKGTPTWMQRDKALFSAVGRGFTLALERAAQTTHIEAQRDALDARSRALEAFALLTRDLTVDVEPLALVRRAQEILLSLLTEGYALYWQPDGARWVNRSQVGSLGHPGLQQVVDAGLPRGQAATLDQPWNTQQATFQDVYSQGADTSPELVAHVRAAAMLPVLVNGEPHGMIGVGLFVQRHWTPMDKGVLVTVTRSLGLALEGAESAQALKQRTKELERSNAELEKFAYVASHDLQEPLRTIGSFSELIQRRYGEKLDERGRTYLGLVTRGAARMKLLIDDLLVFSRLNAVQEPHSVVPLAEPLQEALGRLHAALEQSGAVVRHGPLPAVAGNLSELTQLFQNLISNAIKFRRAAVPPEIHVGAVREGTVWHVTVQDNGIGFEAQYAERVFQIFQRLHLRDEFEGTGMGLAIVRKIVDHHGGRVWATSEPGMGSTFHFTLTAMDEA